MSSLSQSESFASPYTEGYRVKVTRFANGAAECYAEKNTLYRHRSGELRKPSPARVMGGRRVAERKAVDLARAEQRARQRMRQLVVGQGLDHLLTLTYRENMQDEVRAKADWKMFLAKVMEELDVWPFVVAREPQQRGAWHFHAAVKGFQDLALLRRCWPHGSVNVKFYEARWGNVSHEWHSNKLAGYLSKYIGKSFAESKAWSKRYRSSVVPPADRPCVEVYWWQAMDDLMLIEEVYELVAGDTACGVVHCVLPGSGLRYWLSVPPRPSHRLPTEQASAAH